MDVIRFLVEWLAAPLALPVIAPLLSLIVDFLKKLGLVGDGQGGIVYSILVILGYVAVGVASAFQVNVEEAVGSLSRLMELLIVLAPLAVSLFAAIKNGVMTREKLAAVAPFMVYRHS